MHPNTFLRTFWRTHYRPEVFVAMSFAPEYEHRFIDIIEPSVRAVEFHGKALTAKRVDLSKSGDSILTDIIDGVAHSVMVLADVSIVGHDSKTSRSYRNGNVMYEVGLALSCRQSSEVLLIRDDKEPFLFDVSTVPHMHIDFADSREATRRLSEELRARLREIDHVNDARLALAVASLTDHERSVLRTFSKYGMELSFGLSKSNLATRAALSRLLDKQLIRTVGVTNDAQGMFRWTELGHVLAAKLDLLVPVVGVQSEVPAMGSGSDEVANDAV